MHDSTDQSEDDIMDIEEDMDIEHQGAHYNNTGLRNIFEEYDQHFCWNELNIYDLH